MSGAAPDVPEVGQVILSTDSTIATICSTGRPSTTR